MLFLTYKYYKHLIYKVILMKNKNFKSVLDIKLYLELCYEQYDKIDRYIKRTTFEFFSSERKEAKKQLRQVELNIRKTLSNLESLSTFDCDSFLPFLKDYLSIVEDEEYVLLANVQEDDYIMAMVTHTYPLSLFSDYYNIITTASNAEKLQMQKVSGTTDADTDDIRKYLSVCDDEKYICLKSKERYSLLNGTALNKNFSSYPYLLDVAYKLADLKLKKSELTNEARLNIILSEAKTNKLGKYK